MFEVVDEAIYTKRNGDKINKGIYSFKTNDELRFEAYANLEGIGWNEYLLNRNANAENKLRKNKKTISESIGKDSYDDIMELFGLFNGMLESDVEELRESRKTIDKVIDKNAMYDSNMIPEQTLVTHTLHNLVWHRITREEQFLIETHDIDSPDFKEFIYYIKFDFIEYDNSWIKAIIYLNGKHYEYIQAPQFADWCFWSNEIEETQVRDKIIELRGEIYDGFEIFNPDLQVCKSKTDKPVMANKYGNMLLDYADID